MKVLPPDKVRTHAQRSILTKGIGLSLFVKPDLTKHTLKEGDRLILCSDGLWSVIEDDEFADLVSTARSAEHLGESLIDLALARNSDDNISTVVIYVRHLAEGSGFHRVSSSLQWEWPLRDLLPDPLNRFLNRNHNGRHRQ